MPLPETDRADRATAMRSALLATLGLALWLGAPLVLVLSLNIDDGGNAQRWGLALRWLLSNGGALLALLGAHGLAKAIRTTLRRRPDMSTAAGEDRHSRRSPALALVAVGLALNAFTESQSFLIDGGDSLPPAYGAAILVAAYAAPVALTVGTYLALRRLAVLIGSQSISEDGDQPAHAG